MDIQHTEPRDNTPSRRGFLALAAARRRGHRSRSAARLHRVGGSPASHRVTFVVPGRRRAEPAVVAGSRLRPLDDRAGAAGGERTSRGAREQRPRRRTPDDHRRHAVDRPSQRQAAERRPVPLRARRLRVTHPAGQARRDHPGPRPGRRRQLPSHPRPGPGPGHHLVRRRGRDLPAGDLRQPPRRRHRPVLLPAGRRLLHRYRLPHAAPMASPPPPTAPDATRRSAPPSPTASSTAPPSPRTAARAGSASTVRRSPSTAARTSRSSSAAAPTTRPMRRRSSATRPWPRSVSPGPRS